MVPNTMSLSVDDFIIGCWLPFYLGCLVDKDLRVVESKAVEGLGTIKEMAYYFMIFYQIG